MDTKHYTVTLSALDRAVVAQMGGECRNTSRGCEIDEDTAERLADVCRCSCGAAGGFTGFIYYSETREFTAANRAAILDSLREQIAEGLWPDSSAVGAVCSFNCFKNDNRAEIEEEAARVLFGPVDDIRGGELDCVANALAWAALEDLAYKLDGQEDDEGEAEGGDDGEEVR